MHKFVAEETLCKCMSVGCIYVYVSEVNMADQVMIILPKYF